MPSSSRPPQSGSTSSNNNQDQDQDESFGDKMSRMARNCGHATGLCCFKAKEQTQISVLESKVTARQRKFGVEYIGLVKDKSSQDQLQVCLNSAMKDIAELQTKINEHYDNIDDKEADINDKIVPPGGGGGGPGSGPGPGDNNGGSGGNRPLSSRRPQREDDEAKDEEGGGTAAALNSRPNSSSNRRPNDGGSPKKQSSNKPNNNNGSGGGPKKSRNPAKSGGKGGGKAPAAAAASSSLPQKEAVPEAYQKANPKKWKIKDQKFAGSASYDTKGHEEVIKGTPIQQGMDRFKLNPGKYAAMLFQTTMLKEKWPAGNCKFTYIHREGTENYRPQGVSPAGWMTILLQQYERCTPFPDDVLPKAYRDKHTDSMTFQRRKLHTGKNKPLMPGRGMGVGDTPLLKIIGDVDPSDISQGQVGDCWLLSGISSLAEFDGGIKKLFRKTKNLMKLPLDQPNMYTITLWDLKTWKEVDIEIDERLPCAPDGNGLLASRPSEDGELWVPLLEKALAVHCGGWDKIVGGQCTHAWALMTGCKEQYTIRVNPKTGKYGCFGKFNPNTKKWAQHANSPHDGDQSVWPVPWPKVGGGGPATQELTEGQLFKRMVAWDKTNYIVGAGTKGTSDKESTGGLVDNHAYSVIESHSNVAGTGIDLLKVRNPWGSGEIEDGEFDDDGPGWDKYPQIKKILKPVVADDGIFWVTQKEFFHFYSSIFLSCSDMTEFLED